MEKLVKISALLEKNKIKKTEELNIFVEICQLLKNQTSIKLNDICVRFCYPKYTARKIIHTLCSRCLLIDYDGSLGYVGFDIKLTRQGKNLKTQLQKITK
jgi:hypothetical protein